MESWQSRPVEELFVELSSTHQGISSGEGVKRLEKYGPNQLAPAPKPSLLYRSLQQLKDPMILVLLIAAALSYWASGGEDWLDATIILVIVLVNNVIALSQEDHAQKALEALEKMSSPQATVLRDGKEERIPAKNLVVGDVILLSTGDYVPGDGRLLQAVSLQVDESAMTGESVPVDKRLASSLPSDAPVGDWHNMVIAGTLVTAGHGKALVVATGMDSQMGKIAQLLQESPSQPSPLQVKMAEVSKTLSFLCLAICGLMFGVGLLQGKDLLSMFMTAVALAVAAIPEGLPAVVSIVLALGMSRMAEQGAIVKKLPAVETLGCASVICSDKTGTLTQNKMMVQACVLLPGTPKPEALRCALLCSNAKVGWRGSTPVVTGNPTEVALAAYATQEGLNKEALAKELPKIEEIPFSSDRKLMSTYHPHPEGGYLVLVKGAPDVLLGRCTHSIHGPLSGRERQEISQSNERLAGSAMRVIAVAQRHLAFLPPQLTSEHLEQGLSFLGLFGITDPPRPEAKRAVSCCHKAGVRPVMITGDHRATAVAIAKELEIFRPGDWAVTGPELDFMPQSILEQDIAQFSVFARVSPAHKMRIVQAWQKKGRVVAVTGDGVNDAPALKAADIGCAMGISGTDVAKGAAHMILTGDNFHTIVEAVEEGRGIYANIRKAIHYLLSCNIGEIVAIFLATVGNFATMPLMPVQLLWLNLVTDTLPALALGVEPVEEGMMALAPRDPQQGLFDRAFSLRLLWQGLMVGGLTLLAYGLGYFRFFEGTSPEITPGQVANSMAFATLTLSQLFHAFNVRSDSKSLFTQGFFSNPAMNQAFVVGLALQLAVLTLPPLQAVFSVVPMTLPQWGTVLALAFAPIPICELVKAFGRGNQVQGKRVLPKETALRLASQLNKTESAPEIPSKTAPETTLATSSLSSGTLVEK